MRGSLELMTTMTTTIRVRFLFLPRQAHMLNRELPVPHPPVVLPVLLVVVPTTIPRRCCARRQDHRAPSVHPTVLMPMPMLRPMQRRAPSHHHLRRILILLAAAAAAAVVVAATHPLLRPKRPRHPNRRCDARRRQLQGLSEGLTSSSVTRNRLKTETVPVRCHRRSVRGTALLAHSATRQTLDQGQYVGCAEVRDRRTNLLPNRWRRSVLIVREVKPVCHCEDQMKF
mmetsp:Transcript_2324/g.5334  ORF Transcript_2324/g.5334 Transcript_2324/m.5334 type:complete len:228 (+) Transcript_2324:1024-1707(+)